VFITASDTAAGKTFIARLLARGLLGGGRTNGGGSMEEDRTNGGGAMEVGRTNGGGSMEEDRTNGGGAMEEDRTNGGGAMEGDRSGGSEGYPVSNGPTVPSVAYWKPVASGGDRDVTGMREEGARIIDGLTFPEPVSPTLAARRAGDPITLDETMDALLKGLAAMEDGTGDGRDTFLVAEGAGGLASPLLSDALNRDLAVGLGLPLLLVVPNRLGAINQSLLLHEYARGTGLQISALVLNDVPITEMERDEGLEGDLRETVLSDNVVTVSYLCEGTPVFRVPHGAVYIPEALLGVLVPKG